MRAAVIDKAGPPESFRIAEVCIPSPQETEVVIRQKFAAINFGDVIRRKRGLFGPNLSPPFILGFEGMGTIEYLGTSVSDLRVGDRVAYLTERGGYAEFVSVPAGNIWTVPAAISDQAAAAITCVGMTAWGLVAQSGARPGQIALVHGAGGGVGSILIQILASQGTQTIALVTGSAKQAFVSKLGASITIDRSQGAVEREIKKAAPSGVDVVFDCVGNDVLDVNLATIKPGGVWMYYGSTSGHPEFPGDRILMNRLSLRGFVVFDFARDRTVWHEGIAFLSAALERKNLIPQTAQILPLQEVSEAHRLLEAREAHGKVILSF